QYRLLFRHHLEGAGFPDLDVHRPLRAGPHRGLDRPVEGDAGRPASEDRPPAPDLYRPDRTGLCADGEAEITPLSMAGLDPAIQGHKHRCMLPWMAGSSPPMASYLFSTNSSSTRAARRDGASS